MKKKKLLSIALSLLVAVAIAGCGKKEESSTVAEQQEAPIVEDVEDAEVASANTVSDIPNPEKPVIFYNRQPLKPDGSIDMDALTFNKDTYYVGCDSVQGADIQGQMIADYILENGDELDRNGDGVIGYVLAIGDLQHSDSISRTEAVRKHLGTAVTVGGKVDGSPVDSNLDGSATNVKDGEVAGVSSKIREIASKEMKNSVGTTWDASTATNTIGTWAYEFEDQIDLVIANNDGMGMAMFKAWSKDAGVPTFGYDANSDAVAAIPEGYAGTVEANTYVQAYITLRLIRNALDGEDIGKGITIADSYGNYLKEDSFKYVDEERAYYAKNVAVTAKNYENYLGSGDIPEHTSFQLDEAKSPRKRVWLSVFNASNAYLNSSYVPYLEQYDDIMNLDVEYVLGDGQTEANIVNRFVEPAQYDAFAINMIKVEDASSYTSILEEK